MGVPPSMTATSSELRAEAVMPRVSMLHLRRGSGWLWWWLCMLACMGGLGAYTTLVYAPQRDRPHTFTALAFLFSIGLAGVVLFSGTLIGLRLFRSLRVAGCFARDDYIVLATGVGLGAVSLAVLGIGLLHLYYGLTFAALLTVLPWLFPEERRWLARYLRDLPRRFRAIRWRGLSLPDYFARVIFGLICLSALCLSFAKDLTPPSSGYGYDTYQYHWAVPALLLRYHGWVGFPGWAHANLPFNTEMLNLVALSLNAPQAATLLQDAFGLLTGLLLFSFVRRRFGELVAWMALAAQVSVPLFIVYTSQSYVETALVFYGFATIVILVRWLERGTLTHRRDEALLILTGVSVGLAVGVKYTAMEYLPAVVLLVAGGLAIGAWQHYRNVGRLSFAILSSARGIGIFGGAALLVFAPWAIKDWIFLGNPVYPALASVFGAPLWNTMRDRTLEATFRSFGAHTGFAAQFHLFALDMFLHPMLYGEGGIHSPGLIELYAVLALPFLIIAVVNRKRFLPQARAKGPGWMYERRRVLAIGVLTLSAAARFAVWTWSGALVERYALPAIMLSTTLGAVMLGLIVSAAARRAALAACLLIVFVSVMMLGQETTYLFQDVGVRTPLSLLLGQKSEDTFMRQEDPRGMPPDFWRMTDYVNTRLPHDGKLLMLGRGTGYFFADRDYVADSGGDWVPYLVSEGKTPDGILHILRSQGFTYVVYDARVMRWLTGRYQNTVLAASIPTYLDFQQQHLLFVGQWGDISLYRVPPSA